MDITIKKINDINARIAISITKSDYQFLIKKSLNNLCKSVIIDGFRKGNVPKSIIQSMYGKNILVEELNKLVSNKLSEYIKENKLYILGNPLLIKNNLNLDNQEDYEFLFDIGLQPEVNISLTKDDKLPYYTIVVTDEMIEKQINTIKKQYGKYDTNMAVVTNEATIKGKLIELNEDDTPLKNGINLSDVIINLLSIKNEVEKGKFIVKKVGDVIIFNPYKAFDGDETKLSDFLKIKKTELINYQGNFSFTITEISHYKQAEVNQELFDKLYGIGIVTSEKMFREKIKKSLVLQLQSESDFRLLLDVKQLLLERIKEVPFPEDFLKRWLIEVDTNITEETVEKDFPNAFQAIKTQFIWNKMIEDNEIKVTSEDMKQAAKALVQTTQFALLNLHVIEDNALESYANEILKTEKGVQQSQSRALEIKIITFLKEKINLTPVSVTEEEFQKIA